MSLGLSSPVYLSLRELNLIKSISSNESSIGPIIASNISSVFRDVNLTAFSILTSRGTDSPITEYRSILILYILSLVSVSVESSCIIRFFSAFSNFTFWRGCNGKNSNTQLLFKALAGTSYIIFVSSWLWFGWGCSAKCSSNMV